MDTKNANRAMRSTQQQQLSKDERKLIWSVIQQSPRTVDIPLHKLNIDYSYQDRPRARLVDLIATQFAVGMLGTFIVSERPDGTFWVCDGATRKLGLEKGGQGNRSVPCQVFKTSGIKQEALLFKIYNGFRKQVPLANRLNAEGVAGLNGLRATVNRCGYSLIGNGKNVLKGATFLMKAYEIDDGISLEKALYSLHSSWGSEERLDGITVLGVSQLIHSQKKSIDEQLRRTLRRTPQEKIDEIVTKIWGGGRKMGARLHPDSRPPLVAKALALLINKYPGRSGSIDIGRVEEEASRLAV